MTDATILTLDNLDYEGDVDCSLGVVGASRQKTLTDLVFVPAAGKPPVVGKILPDFRAKNRANFPIEYHEFSIGSTIQDTRFFFSSKCFGEEDVLTSLFWKALKERKKFAENKDSKDYRYWDFVVKMCRPKRGCLLYWVGKGESRVQVMMLKEPMMHVLFGAPARKDHTGKDVPPIEGAVKEMREMGLSPFNLKDSAGWVMLYKTGSGSSTQFHAELEVIKKEEINKAGRRVFKTEPTEAAVDAAILKVDTNTIIEFTKVCQERSWSKEEMEAYISSDFTTIPQRYFRKTQPQIERPEAYRNDSGGQEVVNKVEAAYDVEDTCNENDIPF